MGRSTSGTLLHYLNSQIHRVVKQGWIQGGDIDGGHGDKGESIYGPTFSGDHNKFMKFHLLITYI